MERHLGGLDASPAAAAAEIDATAVRNAAAGVPIDWDEFVSLADGDDAVTAELIQLFIDSGDASLREIRDAVGRGDLTAVGRAAHAFKGSSANIRAAPASAAAARLEEAARAGAADALAELEKDLHQEAGRLKEFLTRRC